MEYHLVKPVLQGKKARETKTYNIYNFFIIGLIFGIIPIMILGTCNAIWLKEPKKKIYILLMIGIMTLLAMFICAALIGDIYVLKIASRIAAAVVTGVYIYALRERFRIHNLVNESTESLRWIGLIIGIVGIMAQTALLVGGEMLYVNFTE
ncbi:hypothetical protein COE15_13730 [Bacillus cereus]|uniref:hypothetical protein n=1 Tax=unclassified Bacillus (in: firmicutes) TaxID=185979 RepID=UPI00089A9531|nr:MULTISPECIES: hypothetical protein [unclassified Bacillus (in: firmicutes)]PFE04588.1 hypothetical protein CN288_07685 [Bacillus sp. AFS023182]PGY00382.1 hypothetical protein COE15_13730 [Bacillus cereus]SDZ27868.1 hypothetical protein SAMN04488156_11328 [Bacillus sp. 166amftsu]